MSKDANGVKPTTLFTFSDPPYNRAERNWLVAYWDSEQNFLETFTLNINKEWDRKEGRRIVRQLMEDKDPVVMHYPEMIYSKEELDWIKGDYGNLTNFLQHHRLRPWIIEEFKLGKRIVQDVRGATQSDEETHPLLKSLGLKSFDLGIRDHEKDKEDEGEEWDYTYATSDDDENNSDSTSGQNSDEEDGQDQDDVKHAVEGGNIQVEAEDINEDAPRRSPNKRHAQNEAEDEVEERPTKVQRIR